MTTQTLHLSYGFDVRGMKDEERALDVVASSSAIDSYGEVVVQDWDLSRYEKNPVVFFGHRSNDLPIGRAENVRVEDGRLVATIKFLTAEANEMAEKVWQSVKQGALRAVSVGFRPKQVAMVDGKDGKKVPHLMGNELIEISVVGVPANPEAVALERKALDTMIRALASANETTTEGETPQETTIMSTINKALFAVLALASTASEDDALSEVQRLKSVERDMLDLLGVDSAAAAVGVVRGLKAAAERVKTLEERAQELALSLEKRDRDDLIARARKNGQISPAQVAWAESCPIEALRGFVATAPAIPQFREQPREDAKASSSLSYRGKSWSELTPSEKHDLYNENRDLYTSMRDEAKRAA